MIILAQKRIKALVESETVALMNLPLEDVVLWRDAAHSVEDLRKRICQCDEIPKEVIERDGAGLCFYCETINLVFFGNEESSDGNEEVSHRCTRFSSSPKKTILHCDLCGLREVETTIEKELLKEALNRWGDDFQIMMLFEEMGELMQAISKFKRGRLVADRIAEEIADVEILLNQMKLLYGIERDASIWKKEKLNKLRKILKGA